MEARSQLVLAESLLALGKTQAAKEAMARAAGIHRGSGRDELESLIQKASEKGMRRIELEARMMAMRGKPDQLGALARDARERGFIRLAHLAER